MPAYGFAASSNPWPAVTAASYAAVFPHDIYGNDGDNSISVFHQTPPAGKYFSLHLGGGNDSAAGSEYFDRIDGEDGNDSIWGHGGNDWLFGGAGNDLLVGDSGVAGPGGNDFLDGGDHNDTLHGEAGNDWLKGGSGDDILYGDSGNDVLDGGLGYDVLQGGSGADRYVLTDKDTVDLIQGFGQGDKIDISALLDSETNFGGTTAAQAYYQGYYYFSHIQSSNTTVVHIDPNGGAHGGGDFAVVELFNVNPGEWASLSFIV